MKQINDFEPTITALSDDELIGKTNYFKEILKKNKDLEAILPEAFAVVREASKRVLSMRHFDMQLLGGIILHRGMIAEMKTGEGKTLVATLPAYLNALIGESVHIITVNEYLAARDAEWMGSIFRYLGLKVSHIANSMNEHQKKLSYASDIVYGTNNEFGFDYLKDNMRIHAADMVQGGLNFAIVDEVDSILVDEARTPLVISGNIEGKATMYIMINDMMSDLQPEYYEMDEKQKSIGLTENGFDFVERMLIDKKHIEKDSSLYDIDNMELLNYINLALKAQKLFTRDADYIIKDRKIVIIDEFTGRMMEGRRYSDGLHQAIEAKEGVEIQSENQTLASITFQNYFRMYNKLSGMTGTAKTEEKEFINIYGLKVVPIPTNVNVNRIDEEDEVYGSKEEKYNSLLEIIEEAHKKQQPILVGTTSIEKSEELSRLFKSKNLPHKVLNARYHKEEAFIIAQAGQPGSITIATNMAGRGTDIKLGGNAEMLIKNKITESTPESKIKQEEQKIIAQVAEDKNIALEAGGLYVIGTERHESRRIDNQLRGRSGRQGDPGKSKFLLSLDDDLLRIFGSDKVKGLLTKFGLEKGESITHPWITNALEKAQVKIESRNFDIRKSLLKFDDIINEQRSVIYSQRSSMVNRSEFNENYILMIENMNRKIIEHATSANQPTGEIDIDHIKTEMLRIYKIEPDISSIIEDENFTEESLLEYMNAEGNKVIAEKESLYGKDITSQMQKNILLSILDLLWREHLKQLDYLRQSISFRAMAQKNPINEFKKEAFAMFEQIPNEFTEKVLIYFSHARIHSVDNKQSNNADRKNTKEFVDDKSMPRNAPCHCGSGKRYKNCHGKING